MLPSNPAEQEKISKVIDEIVNSKTRAASEQDYQKEAIAELAEEHDLDKAVIRKMADMRFKRNFSEVSEKSSEVFDAYETLFMKDSDAESA